MARQGRPEDRPICDGCRPIVAIDDLLTIFDIRMGLFVPQRTPFAEYSIRCAVDVIVALYLLLGTRHLISLLYGREEAGFDVVGAAPEPTGSEEAGANLEKK
jgi:hypothetical protein